MLVVGLTGGIGSGKTEVARRFESLGVPVIDTDVIARELVKPGNNSLEQITVAFGTDILRNDGSLDRRKLRELVFSDTSRRLLLEDILHPRIRDEVIKKLADLQAGYAIVVIPLLLETRYPIKVDRVLVVDVPPEQQAVRVRKRDKVTADSARKIIENQAARIRRLAAADDIVDNSGQLTLLEDSVRRLHEKYLRLAKSTPVPTAPESP
jgi:dephospho-CoA kinase